jgi:hypothetical protein
MNRRSPAVGSNPVRPAPAILALVLRRLIPIGVALAVVLVLCQIAAQLVDYVVYGLRIAPLDSDAHASIFGALSLAAQGAAAIAAGIAAVRSDHRAQWAATTALTAALLVARVAVGFKAAFLIVPVAVLFVLLWETTRDEPRDARLAVGAGLMLLVFSFAVHVAGPRIVSGLGYSAKSWPYQVKGLLKHSAELGGWTLVATGVVALGLGREPLRQE